MSIKTYMYLYKSNSEGGNALKAYLDLKAIKHEGSSINGGPEVGIINWGTSASHWPEDQTLHLSKFIINQPIFISKVVNKLETYKLLEGVCRIPDWTTRQGTVNKWLFEGEKVIGRKLLKGSKGEGAFIVAPTNPTEEAKVWCKVIPKTHEYRVHFVGDKIVGYQIKIKSDHEVEDPNEIIRSYNHGWKLVNLISYVPPADIITQATLAFRASALDFGAVDVGWDSKAGKAYVFEINSAPWLNQNFVRYYGDAIKELIAAKLAA